jgi:biopolymer transport protein ExbB
MSRRFETGKVGSRLLLRLLWRMVRPALPIVLLVLIGGVLIAQDGAAAADATPATATAPENDVSGMPTDPVSIMKQLGWMGWLFLVPFVGATLIALWYTVERMVVLKRSRVIPRPFVERFLEHLRQGKLDRNSSLKLCEQSDSPIAAVFAHGVRKWGKSSVEVEQAIIDGGERQVSELRVHLRVLNGVATVTPLLGLLGTVLGMIQAFNDIATADSGKTEQLAVGISLALLTTACGLMIAIPTLIMYMFLSGRVDALVMEMDYLAQSVVQTISAEALAERTRDSSGRSKRAV